MTDELLGISPGWATTLLTLVLVLVTTCYAVSTHRMMKAAVAQADAARSAYLVTLRPELEVEDASYDSDTGRFLISLKNTGSNAALLIGDSHVALGEVGQSLAPTSRLLRPAELSELSFVFPAADVEQRRRASEWSRDAGRTARVTLDVGNVFREDVRQWTWELAPAQPGPGVAELLPCDLHIEQAAQQAERSGRVDSWFSGWRALAAFRRRAGEGGKTPL